MCSGYNKDSAPDPPVSMSMPPVKKKYVDPWPIAEAIVNLFAIYKIPVSQKHNVFEVAERILDEHGAPESRRMAFTRQLAEQIITKQGSIEEAHEMLQCLMLSRSLEQQFGKYPDSLLS